MSESPDPFYRSPATPITYSSNGVGHHSYTHHPLPQSSFKLPPIRTLGLAHQPPVSPATSTTTTTDMPPPQMLPRESWSRSSAGVRPLSSEGGPPHLQQPDSPYHSNLNRRPSSLYGSSSTSSTQPPQHYSQQQQQQQQHPEPLPAMSHGHPSSEEGYAAGSQRRPSRLDSPPPPSTSTTASSATYPGRGGDSYQSQSQSQQPLASEVHSYGGPPPPPQQQQHMVETRPVVPYPTTAPNSNNGSSNNNTSSQIYHAGAPAQQAPYAATPYPSSQQQGTAGSGMASSATATAPGPPPQQAIPPPQDSMYGQRSLPPQAQGPPPPAYGYNHSQAPPMSGYSEWAPPPVGPTVPPPQPMQQQPQQPPPHQPQYNGYHDSHHMPPPQQQQHGGAPYPPQPQHSAPYGAIPAQPMGGGGQYSSYPSQQHPGPSLSGGPPALEWSNPAPLLVATPISMSSVLPPQPVLSTSVITAAPADKPIAQILEHCQRIMAFANYYAGFQPHAPGAPPRPQRPSIPETKEMAQRAETIVQILFKLADESRPIRKALDNSTLNNANSAQQQRAPTPIVNVNYPDRDPATGKKKRKMSERERDNENAPQHANGGAENEDGADENDPPHANGAEGGAEAEWGMTKEQRLKMFGENQEAFDLAEKDMRTITAKRTASQGGVLPQQKTKYKKRSRATPPGKCHSCFSTETPEWRRGPDGARTLCNACGLHFAKLAKRSPQTYITIPMLQASAHKNGIGANGIVPAEPGSVNGTVGGMRAALLASNKKDSLDDDDDDDADDNLVVAGGAGKGKQKDPSEGPGASLINGAKSSAVMAKTKDHQTNGHVPAVVVNGGDGDEDDDEEGDEDDDEEEEEDGDGDGERERDDEEGDVPMKSNGKKPLGGPEYPPLQARPMGGSSWGGGGGAPPAPAAPERPPASSEAGQTYNPYLLTPVATPAQASGLPHQDNHANGGPNKKHKPNPKGPAPSNHQTTNGHDSSAKLSSLAPPGWGGPSSRRSPSSQSPPYARANGTTGMDGEGMNGRGGAPHGDDDDDGEMDGDVDGDEDGGADVFRRLRGSSNLRAGGRAQMT